MDKSWMRAIKWSKAYIDGVNTFMRFVETHIGQDYDIRCPCIDCLNLIIKDKRTVKDHIMERGIDPGYITWFYHGEPSSNNIENPHTNEGDRIDSDSLEENDDEEDGINDMLFDLGEQYYQADTDNMSAGNKTNIGSVPAYLEALMMDAKAELYPGCKKISRTSFIIQLLHLKVYNRLSNKTIDMMLRLMKKSFPDGETLPSSYYEAKKFLRDLGLGYECIHACKYDCAIFWKENKNLETCPTCGTSRWKVNDGIGKKIPQKILRRHKEELLLGGCENIDQEHKEQFPVWFKKNMTQLYHQGPSEANESMYSLACAPHKCVRKYTGCIVNGVRFLTKERDSRRKSQNSGIVVEGNHGEDTIDFYGVLTDIIQLDYVKDRHVTIFKCEWFDLGRKKKIGIQKEGNIISIRVTKKWYENDSYVLADQARQVFYINDPKLGVDWRVVQPFQHRHIYDVAEIQDEAVDVDDFEIVEDGAYQENNIDDAFEVDLGEIQSLNREDIDPTDIEELVISRLPEVVDVTNLEDVDEEDEIDNTLVDYCSSEEDSQKNGDSDNESDDDNWET